MLRNLIYRILTTFPLHYYYPQGLRLNNTGTVQFTISSPRHISFITPLNGDISPEEVA